MKIKQVEFCPKCFTIQGSWWSITKEVRKYKKAGHYLFVKHKVSKGVYEACLSRKKQ